MFVKTPPANQTKKCHVLQQRRLIAFHLRFKTVHWTKWHFRLRLKHNTGQRKKWAGGSGAVWPWRRHRCAQRLNSQKCPTTKNTGGLQESLSCWSPWFTSRNCVVLHRRNLSVTTSAQSGGYAAWQRWSNRAGVGQRESDQTPIVRGSNCVKKTRQNKKLNK